MTDEALLQKISHIVASELEPIKAVQQEHSVLLKEHSSILEEHTKSLKTLKKTVRRIDKTLKITIVHFDRRLVSHHKRLEQIEDHLGLTPNQ